MAVERWIEIERTPKTQILRLFSLLVCIKSYCFRVLCIFFINKFFRQIANIFVIFFILFFHVKNSLETFISQEMPIKKSSIKQILRS